MQELPAGCVDPCQGDLLRGPVQRAHAVGTLERHVLEHVRHAADPVAFVDRAHIQARLEGEDRRAFPGDEDECPTVCQGVIADVINGDVRLGSGGGGFAGRVGRAECRCY